MSPACLRTTFGACIEENHRGQLGQRQSVNELSIELTVVGGDPNSMKYGLF